MNPQIPPRTSSARTDELYMHRCLELAAKGLGRTRPNPLVGCVIVKDGAVISEGYHQKLGENHAERNAILRIWDPSQGPSLHGATLYVNLEPCSHFGLTPPCADLVAESGISRVVCCNDDPNPKVAGRGFQRLRDAGIEVVQHVLEPEGRFLNRRFFTYMEQRRPYIILKWAQTSDGFMAHEGPYWISSPLTTQLSHRWRTEEAAILVGAGTVRDDNPSLTARLWHGENPLRIVMGGTFEPDRLAVFNSDAPTLHYPSHTSLKDLTDDLFQRKIQSLIVEGGRKILDFFLESGLWDEIRVVTSPKAFQHGLPAPQIMSSPSEVQELDGDQIAYHYHN